MSHVHSRPSDNHRRSLPPPVVAPPVNNSNSQPKKRRVIEDDDDDDVPLPPAPKPRTAAGPAAAGSGATAGSNGKGINGSSSVRPGDRQSSGKKKIVPGPPRSGSSGAGVVPKTEVAPSKSSRPVDDHDDDDTPLGTILKNKQQAKAASLPGPNSGMKRDATSFKIPKREVSSLPSSRSKPSSMSSSSSPRPIGGSSSSSSNLKNSGRSGGGRAGGGDDNDADFEPKPNKVIKRPGDFTRAPESAAKLARRKRKLEEEQQRLREEAARKKKRRQSQASPASRAKVKPEPSRKGSSASSKAKPKRAGSGKSGSAAREQKTKRFKATTRAEKIEQAMKVYKWWEEPAREQGKQWESLEHNGAHFAPPYKPHGVKLKYDGADVHLTPQQEEVATFYASVSLFSFPSLSCRCRLHTRSMRSNHGPCVSFPPN